MPRADYAVPYTVTHVTCGNTVKATYAIKTVNCSVCDGKFPADQWLIEDKGNESLKHVRKIDKQIYEEEERIRLSKEVREETRQRAERSERMAGSKEDESDYAETSESGGSSGFEQGSQESIRDRVRHGNRSDTSYSTKKANANILVQVMYNMHDLVAEQYGQAYSLRQFDAETQTEFKKILVEVSDEIGMNVELNPLQRFGLMYGSMVMQMRANAKSEGYVDVTPDEDDDTTVEVEDVDNENPIIDDSTGSIYK